MNFDEAIKAHSDWKVKLRSYINGNNTSKDYDLNVVSADHLCTLGKWIYGDGKKYEKSPNYEPLRLAHAKLHKLTADILRETPHGSKDFKRIEPGSEYAELSLDVVSKIRKIRKEITGA